MIVLDYETQPAPFSVMKQLGVGGAIVYVAPLAWGWPKTIRAAEVAVAQAAGFPLALNFEAGTQDYLGGPAKGTAHGLAIYQALNELKVPTAEQCYLSIDTDVGPANFQLAADYFAAARLSSGRELGLYGTTALANYLADRGLLKRHWRSASHGYYGNVTTGRYTVVDQVGAPVAGLGGSYDVNTVLQADWGQLGAAPAVGPTPTPIEDSVTYFYRVTDNAAVSPNSVWVTDFIWTRHVGSPAALSQDQLWAAYEGAPHIEIHDMPYAFHVDLWQKPEIPASPALPNDTEPTHFVGTVDLHAAP